MLVAYREKSNERKLTSIKTCYRVLDISVNRLTKIEGLEKLENLRKLYLCSNKIQKIENVNHLKNLEEIELGDNKIRVSF